MQIIWWKADALLRYTDISSFSMINLQKVSSHCLKTFQLIFSLLPLLNLLLVVPSAKFPAQAKTPLLPPKCE
jgi:hypothetical protein